MTTTTNNHQRAPSTVMHPERLGAMHQTRLSFTRHLLRKMAREQWRVHQHDWQLNPQGFGHVIYQLNTPNNRYHLVVFCDQIADHERNDRVIAEKWDVTFALVEGDVDTTMLLNLRANVPLQEAGRNSNNVLILARANKSVRVFEHLVERLSNGEQPDSDLLTQVGYILRTTAVYGNGKFGIADFKKLENNPDFNTAFAAQLCAVYLLRQFSLDWVHYIAAQQNPQHATRLTPAIQTYIGIGNATGLGMAPYLINHPRVVDAWLSAREHALSAVCTAELDRDNQAQLCALLARAKAHLQQIDTIDNQQDVLNQTAESELEQLITDIKQDEERQSAADIRTRSEQYSLETQEILIACLLECFPDLVDPYEDQHYTDETLSYPTGCTIGDIKRCLTERYTWATDIDFDDYPNRYWFWYRSQEKEEPRMGVRDEEPGQDRELSLDIARQVNRFNAAIAAQDDNTSLSSFLLEQPKWRSIARRIWTMTHSDMGDIQINVLHRNTRPMVLLRCKLAILGATKFDPRSDRWVRVTFFQGAPLLANLHDGEWLFPLLDKDFQQQPEHQPDTLTVSQNELTNLVYKAFTGLRREHGEADVIANMVAELQMCGLDGIAHFTRCLPFFTPETDSNISIQAPDDDHLTIDLHHDSLACHMPAIADYLLEYMEGKGRLHVHLQHCHSRFLAHSELVKLTKAGIACKARWRNGADARETCYILNSGCAAPDLFIADEDTTLIDENRQDLHLTLSRHDFDLSDIDMPYATHINAMQLMLAYQRSLQDGIEVNTNDWQQLKQAATAILVENSEHSRKGAGE
ncbi:DUF3726 domain-containing protein [Cardiobacteriaceae bacterium TAE3-ERU3]|nr:DUF3726 domain-containing protein [Cardiobacteriaceae bacterium TAE3-ERU3]